MKKTQYKPGCWWRLDDKGHPVIINNYFSYIRSTRTDPLDDERRYIKKSEVITKSGENFGELSTVFLCLDHGFNANKKPVLWETMLFCEGKLDGYLIRATSRKQAIKNHNRILKAIRNGHTATVLKIDGDLFKC